jgi:hypothetical protein
MKEAAKAAYGYFVLLGMHFLVRGLGFIASVSPPVSLGIDL